MKRAAGVHSPARAYPRSSLYITCKVFRWFTRIGNRMHTIAVIEDDPSMLRGLNRLLSAHGFRVQRFTSAESFLDNIATCEAKCIVVDIHLGGISGIDLQRLFTSSGRHLPGLISTGTTDQ